jgi:hypothetical protein
MNFCQRFLLVLNTALFATMAVSDGVGQAIVACVFVTALSTAMTWVVGGHPRMLITGEDFHEL